MNQIFPAFVLAAATLAGCSSTPPAQPAAQKQARVPDPIFDSPTIITLPVRKPATQEMICENKAGKQIPCDAPKLRR